MFTTIFHTVPIHSDSITRDTQGNKVDSKGNTLKHPAKWQGFATNRNTENSPIMAAIAATDFIGIDLDTYESFVQVLELTYPMLLNYIKHPDGHQRSEVHTLPPETLGYVAQSDLIAKGGHIMFKYSKRILEDILTPEIINLLHREHKIDVQAHAKLLYLATPANETKTLLTTITKLEDLPDMPETVLAYLRSKVTESLMTKLKQVDGVTVKTDYSNTDYLGFVLKEEPTPLLVHRLTPKRDFPSVMGMNDIPQGAGTEWMLQVRRKLQKDSSVSPEKLLSTMTYLNSLWADPMSQDRVNQDCMRDINSTEFSYNEHWEKQHLVLQTHSKTALEVMVDPATLHVILFDRTIQQVYIYQKMLSAADAVLALTSIKLTKDVLIRRARKVHVVDDPTMTPFLNEPESQNILPKFNIFKPSIGLRILHNPEEVQSPRHPEAILAFLNMLVPDKEQKDRLLRYITYKYKTYEYSPLYIVLAGAVGAGKGVFINSILKYFSPDRLESVRVEQLLGNFNSYMMGTDWLEIDEAGEGYTKLQLKQLVGELKRITGSDKISVTLKGVDAQRMRHYVTPILTTNLTTKLITDSAENDRRMVVVRAPTSLVNNLPIELPSGKVIRDTRELITSIESELPHFAVYLAKLYTTTSPEMFVDEYTSNAAWKTKDYEAYIEASLTPWDRLINALANQDLDATTNILIEEGVTIKQLDTLIVEDYAIIYHTASTRALGVQSLEDILTTTNTLNQDIRKSTKPFRNKKSFRLANKIVGVQTVKFSTKYIPSVYVTPDESTQVLID